MQSCDLRPCTVYLAVMGGSSCWQPTCGAGFGTVPTCGAGYVETMSGQACGNPNDCADGGCSNWALQEFYNTNQWGCPPGFVEGVTVVECVWSGY